MTKRKYQEEMDKAPTLKILDQIMLDACRDLSNQQPRHQMATLSSIYRDNYERILSDDIPY